MEHWLTTLPQAKRQTDLAALEAYNRRSEAYGLVLSERSLEWLDRHRAETLRQNKRFEFGEGVLGKLIEAFCDSPYITQNDYEDTLMELQELFYYFKTECRERVSDDELVAAMRLIYFDAAQGNLEVFSDVDWQTMYQIAVTGRLEGTDLKPPPPERSFGGEYE